MEAAKLNYPGSKWLKHVALEQENELREHLPETQCWSRSALNAMLDRHETLFVKPSLGGGGWGIFKIERHGLLYRLMNKRRILTYRNRDNLFRDVSRWIGRRRYLVQQGISLMSIDRRPIDFRILLLKPKETWELMGVMAKCAARNKYVTNHCNGGSSLTVTQALAQSAGWSVDECREFETTLGDFGLHTAEAMQRHFPNVTELGLDAAVDEQRRLWLLEANTRPHFELFRSHADRTLYNRIRALTRTLRAARRLQLKHRAPLR